MKPSEPDQPIKVEVDFEELEDTDRAADLYDRILRAQAMTAAAKEVTHDGDKP
jgi:hypothetical protein